MIEQRYGLPENTQWLAVAINNPKMLFPVLLGEGLRQGLPWAVGAGIYLVDRAVKLAPTNK